MLFLSSTTFIALMCTVSQTPLHKPMTYRIHLTSGSASLTNTILSTHSDWVREAAQRPTPNGWNTISCLKIIYCTQRLRMLNNPHHFSLCIKYHGKNTQKSKRELIGFFYLIFFINMGSAISISTHAMSYYRNKSIELSLIQVFVKSMGSFTRRAGGKSLWWGRHTFQT